MIPKNNFNLYQRSFDYIKPYYRLIILAIILSVLFSFINGFAAFSFLPVFDIVFQSDSGSVAGGFGTVKQGDNQLSSPTQSDGVFSRFKEWVGNLGQLFNQFLKDVAGIGSSFSKLIRLILFITVLSIIASLIGLLINFIFIIIHSGGVSKLRYDSFDHLSRMPLSYFNQTKSGFVISRLGNDIGGAISLVSQSISELILNVFLAIVYLLLLLFLNLKLALIMLPIVMVVGFFAAFVGKFVRKNQKRILEHQADITAILQEFLSGIKIIKGFSAEGYERNKWKTNMNFWRRLDILNNFNKIFPKHFTDIAAVMVLGIVLIYGGFLINKGSLVVSELLLFFVVLTRFQAPIGALSRVWFGVQSGLAHAERVFDFLDLPKDLPNGDYAIKNVKNEIVFKKVGFNYGEGQIIQEIDFKMAVGSVTALVGPSGSGKTSIADLLLRFYDPISGEIMIDGRNIKEFKIEDYRSLFGVVTQDTFLFHDTVRKNIAYGLKNKVSEEEIFKAAQAANAHEFIKKLPKGYKTIVGDRGVRLSGGERQRIAIARAILRNPEVLILDEATSSLDNESEKLVRTAIDNLIKNRTTLVIAHRLSTIQSADKILVINEGRIIEQGRHEELLRKDGLYRHLYNLQFK